MRIAVDRDRGERNVLVGTRYGVQGGGVADGWSQFRRDVNRVPGRVNNVSARTRAHHHPTTRELDPADVFSTAASTRIARPAQPLR